MRNKWELLVVCCKINGTESASIYHTVSTAHSICVCACVFKLSPKSEIVLEPLNTQITDYHSAVPKDSVRRSSIKLSSSYPNLCCTVCLLRGGRWRQIHSKQYINFHIKNKFALRNLFGLCQKEIDICHWISGCIQ